MKSQRGVVNPRVEISWTFIMKAKKKTKQEGRGGYCESLKRDGGGLHVWKNKKESERKERVVGWKVLGLVLMRGKGNGQSEG